MKKTLCILAAACLPLAAQSADADAAKALLKKNDCFKCHALDKKKDGPSYKEVAAKHKGEADAEQKLLTHMTTSPKVKVDGKEEEHKQIKGKDEEIQNLIKWILSL
ncbi:MAG: c-type cytochrome [Rhodocyclaceae bacterium]|nr:c-type cytochrome [Rhodocyclaceae bacterium]